MSIISKLQKRLLKRTQVRDRIRLKPRGIYILPTREGVIFALLILVMLAAAINFNNSLIFFFTFLMASVAIVSMHMTQQNLLGLTFSIAHVSPVFLFQKLSIPLTISCKTARYSINITLNNHQNSDSDEYLYTDIDAQQTTTVTLLVDTLERGYFKLPPITLSSRFPLGLFRAWTHIELSNDAIIYPAPQPVEQRTAFQGNDTEGSNPHGKGLEDFSGFKNYQVGEPLSRVHWKAYAREQGLLSKTFSGSSHKEYWLNWTDVTGNVEQKLSQLCQLLIQAEQNGDRYGLKLPGKVIAINSGQKHYHQCLKTLALF